MEKNYLRLAIPAAGDRGFDFVYGHLRCVHEVIFVNPPLIKAEDFIENLAGSCDVSRYELNVSVKTKGFLQTEPVALTVRYTDKVTGKISSFELPYGWYDNHLWGYLGWYVDPQEWLSLSAEWIYSDPQTVIGMQTTVKVVCKENPEVQKFLGKVVEEMLVAVYSKRLPFPRPVTIKEGNLYNGVGISEDVYILEK